MNKILSICAAFILWITMAGFGQDTLILQPGPEGKDAIICDYYPDNYGDYPNLFSQTGYHEVPFITRSLFEFDLSSLPPDAYVIEARLSLFYANNPSNPHPQSYNNASLLQRVVTPWEEYGVTWDTQPEVTEENEVFLPSSTSPYQDYPDIDVTSLIQDIITDPENSFGFLFRLQIEDGDRRMFFASSDYEDPGLHPLLKVIYLGCPVPTVDFEYVDEGLSVSFNGISPSATTWHWEFGDGDTSDIPNPVHVYDESGMYQVCLRVEDTCHFAETCQDISICSEAPAAGFSAEIDGFHVQFQNTSVGAFSYYWEFGDEYYSSLENPAHTYDGNGIYNVCLYATNSCGDDTICMEVDICIPPVSSFEFEINEMTVFFESTSVLADEYYWDFGDGYYSSLENPWHDYAVPDNYLVCLTTYNTCGTETTCETLYFNSVNVNELSVGKWIVYPNPARDEVNVNTNLIGPGIIILNDLGGKEVFKQEVATNHGMISIPLNQVNPGIYILRLVTEDESIYSKLSIIR